MEHTRVIISDLHVGQNDDFDIFANPGSNKHTLLTGFLNHVRQQPNPIELVINGDFIDFLQLRPWGDLSRGVALRKIKAIVAKSPSVFNDLGTFLSDPRHKLKILPGNHDVELAYPEVGQVLRDAILQSAPGAEDRLDLFGPPSATRTTYRPKINDVLVQIEHGNEGDPWNSLNYNTLFNDAETGTKNFSYPPGTKMVYDIMNGFKENLSFVDILKPEMPSVILILLAIKPFTGALKIPGAILKALGAAGNSVLSMLRRKVAGQPLGPKPATGVPASDADDLETFLSRTFPGEEPPSDWEVEVFLGSSERPGVTDATLGPKLTKVRLWFLSWALKALVRFQAVKQGEKFFNADHPHNAAAIGARSRLKGEVKLVVFGHTHEALKTEFTEGLYVNCGTWADLVALPRDSREAMLKWLDDVIANKFERTAYPTYVRIEPASRGVDVSLNLWTVGGEKRLWAKNI
jgi:UDP-2,3-diacylglucosamine pyrophosphatase LpxH